MPNFMESYQPQSTVIEKRVYEENGGRDRGYGYDRSVNGKANAGLTLGIIGTVLGAAALYGRGGAGLAGLLGGGISQNGGVPANVNINYDSIAAPAATGRAAYTAGAVGCGCVAPTTFECYAHECEDALALTRGMYDLRIEGLNAAVKAREVDVAEKFSLYKGTRDDIDRVNNRITDELFSQYKYTRDKDDEINNRLTSEMFAQYKLTRDEDDKLRDRISALESRVAVNEAVRPYQDKLIQCEIDKAFTAGINYTNTKTCHMIEGYTCIPNDTVTGLIGATGCCGYRPVSAASAGGATA